MYYFAYGTDLNRKVMKERCPDALPKQIAVLPNYKVVFVGWSRVLRGGEISLKYSHGDKVRGGLYEISDRDARRLEQLEGYPVQAQKLNVTVFDRDDEPIQAVTYMKAGQKEETKPAPDYLAVIQQGYRDWHLV